MRELDGSWGRVVPSGEAGASRQGGAGQDACPRAATTRPCSSVQGGRRQGVALVGWARTGAGLDVLQVSAR